MEYPQIVLPKAAAALVQARVNACCKMLWLGKTRPSIGVSACTMALDQASSISLAENWLKTLIPPLTPPLPPVKAYGAVVIESLIRRAPSARVCSNPSRPEPAKRLSCAWVRPLGEATRSVGVTTPVNPPMANLVQA